MIGLGKYIYHDIRESVELYKKPFTRMVIVEIISLSAAKTQVEYQ